MPSYKCDFIGSTSARRNIWHLFFGVWLCGRTNGNHLNRSIDKGNFLVSFNSNNRTFITVQIKRGYGCGSLFNRAFHRFAQRNPQKAGMSGMRLKPEQTTWAQPSQAARSFLQASLQIWSHANPRKQEENVELQLCYAWGKKSLFVFVILCLQIKYFCQGQHEFFQFYQGIAVVHRTFWWKYIPAVTPLFLICLVA